MEKLSPLQIERLKYQPKLPECLANGINSLEMVEGSATQSVRDQEQIQNLFKNTYGKPVVTFKKASSEMCIRDSYITVEKRQGKPIMIDKDMLIGVLK